MSSAPMDFESCYRALAARDTRFDGLFFTAVKTTGIYCRSVCPARTPRRTSCVFYETAAAAESAGFRPCLRCRPELAPGRPDLTKTLAQAILARVQAGALDEGTVETLAREIGLSSRQIRRILLEQYGVTPIEIAQTQRLLFAKKLLHETELPMTQVALAAGFQSLRRFNAIFKERYAMAPSALRRAAGTATHASDGIVLRLSYRPPYPWAATLGYLAARATGGVELIEADIYSRTVALKLGSTEYRGWVRLRAAAAANGLELQLPTALVPVLLPLTLRLRTLFDLDADPMRIDAHLATDPALASAVATTPGLRVPGAWEPFELALRAVLGQQISVAGASTLSGRMAERFGEAIDTPDARLSRLPPRPERIAGSSIDAIRAVGMPGTRAATVIRLAQFALAGGLEFTSGSTLNEMVTRIRSVPGIGSWTAQYIAMRALRQPDAFPAGDLGLKRAIAAIDGQAAAFLPSERHLEGRSEIWRPWRAYAAAYLWRSHSHKEVT